MAFDAMGYGGPTPTCRGCRGPIRPGERARTLRIPGDADMSGVYHAECARPFASLAHALIQLRRPAP